LSGSISVFGVIDPIVLTRDMRVLDGRNRLRAALEAVHADDDEKAPKFVFFDQLPIDHELVTERDYVASKNLSRRHLTDEQKVAAAALLFHGHTERAADLRKDAIRKVGRGRPAKKAEPDPDAIGRVETNTTYQAPHPDAIGRVETNTTYQAPQLVEVEVQRRVQQELRERKLDPYTQAVKA
jgi:hypothetical protein